MLSLVLASVACWAIVLEKMIRIWRANRAVVRLAATSDVSFERNQLELVSPSMALSLKVSPSGLSNPWVSATSQPRCSSAARIPGFGEMFPRRQAESPRHRLPPWPAQSATPRDFGAASRPGRSSNSWISNSAAACPAAASVRISPGQRSRPRCALTPQLACALLAATFFLSPRQP